MPGALAVHRVGISSTSRMAAEAGARIADEGGNAVDAAVAAVLVSLVTEPGVCSLGGSAFIMTAPPAGEAVMIDGYAEMPGRGLEAACFGRGVRDVYLDYGGGLETTVGYGSIATPGAVAGLGLASATYGRIPWARVMEPAIERARDGFPLSGTSRMYFELCGEGIYGWNPESSRAIRTPAGALLEAGDTVRIEGLAESLERIARKGPGEFYRGELARAIGREVRESDGLLGTVDLEAYEPVVRRPLEVGMRDWRLLINPPPAIGGTALAAMLALNGEGIAGTAAGEWDSDVVRRIARIERAVLEYRERHFDGAEDMEGESTRLLAPDSLRRLGRRVRSGSTVHTSAVDASGLACSITASAGYGSGVMPRGTGIWMNNSLGEQELIGRGFHAFPPGTRLPSNMAPTVGRSRDGGVLSLGTPGADRITSALFQTIVNLIDFRMPLADAVAHPRVHVERKDGVVQAAYERGVPVGSIGLPVREFEELHMFFGGVGAALFSPSAGFTLASDPRRDGGTATGGGSR
ncbi:MAG: gamma-glutamyltransferase [Gammaproteobacteria bacterium]|nr:gamma-glutamyltransferase [Gammaproteobacteria bacterium]MDE0248298.1 gamma-glutamyltransferase [Gammaproteobacteria bacterium]